MIETKTSMAAPFNENALGELVGEGAESKVTEIHPGYVVKEPNTQKMLDKFIEGFRPENVDEQQMLRDIAYYFESDEHFKNYKKDFVQLKEIFGAMLTDTDFVIGEPREGNKSGHYIFQKKVDGVVWTDFSKSLTPQQHETFLSDHRAELLTLIGGARKVLVEFGSPMDLWGGNVMVEQKGKNERLVLIDPGAPSEFRTLIDGGLVAKLPQRMRKLFSNIILEATSSLDEYIKALDLSETEQQEINKQFGITDDLYETAKNELRQKLIDLASREDQED